MGEPEPGGYEMNANTENRSLIRKVFSSFSNREDGVRAIQRIAAVLEHGDEFNMPYNIRGLNCPKTFTVGTIAGCAIEHDEDVEVAVNRAVDNGHSLDPFATPHCSVIASDPSVWENKMIRDINNRVLNFGDIVVIEGVFYEITKLPYNRDQIRFTVMTTAEATDALSS
jgi:hypothetical protein